MNTYLIIAAWTWFIWWLVWVTSAIVAKKKAEQKWNGPQLLSIALIILAFALIFRPAQEAPITPAVAGVMGLILLASGVGVSIWSRFALGRNWSGSIAVKYDGHELVTSGPYRFVRHPIYTSLFFGFIGMAVIVGGLLAWLSVLCGLIAFLIRIPVEGGSMPRLFPEQYAAYRKRTRALISYLF